MISFEKALTRVKEFIEQNIPTMNAPGLAIGLTQRERILQVGTYGLANRDAGRSVTPKTLFQIGSISKSFTSIALLQLQEQGLLELDDPVTKYLPWLELQSAYEPISLRHLMSHTAGIITGNDATVSAYTEAWFLRSTKVTAPPGELFHYSNTSYKILGLVLETILGQNITDILYERIFKPLGMGATTPAIRTLDRAKLAAGYSPFFDDRPLPSGGLLAPATWFESDSADGSICATPADMCRFVQCLLQAGRPLLKTESFEQLIEPVIATGDDIHGEHYGLGLFTQQIDGRRVICHSGGMVGYTSDMLVDQEADLGVIVLTNGPAKPELISRHILKLILATREGDGLSQIIFDHREKIGQAKDYAGQYHCGNKYFNLISRDERLYLEIDSDSVQLEPRGTDRFLVPHPAFELFLLQMGRENDQIVEAIWGGERYVHVHYRGKSSFASPPDWKTYPGHYRSHNPWLSNFRVVLRKGSLVLIYPSGDDEPLYQLEPDLFRIGKDDRSPEFIRFEVIINGKAMQAVFSGGVYSRVFSP